MQLRKSVREKTIKKTVVSSDEDELEEVVTKKTKLTSKGSYIANDTILTEEYGFGKRVRRKNATFKNYKLYDDSDSDFEAGPRGSRKSGPRRKRGSKPREATQIEFLLDWKREINISGLPTSQKASKVVNTKKILEADLKQYGSDLQALFININWRTKHNPSGVKIEDFRKLDINKKVMRNGIVFIWSEKEILGRLIKIMEEKGFFYIENFVIALLDASKADATPKEKEPEVKPKIVVASRSSPVKGRGKKVISPVDSESSSTTESTKNGKVFQEDGNENDYFLHNLEKYPVLQANQLLYEGNSEYLKVSKRVLMMFRRADPKDNTLELRHQRTCDALFDLADPDVSYGASDMRTKEYVYKMMETLLPKACYNPEDGSLKMMELWGDPARPREGWISVCDKS